jgi:hypothetical protein
MQVGVAITFACGRCDILHTLIAALNAIILLDINSLINKRLKNYRHRRPHF